MARPKRAHFVRPPKTGLAVAKRGSYLVGTASAVQARTVVVANRTVDPRPLSHLARCGDVRNFARSFSLGRQIAGIRWSSADRSWPHRFGAYLPSAEIGAWWFPSAYVLL